MLDSLGIGRLSKDGYWQTMTDKICCDSMVKADWDIPFVDANTAKAVAESLYKELTGSSFSSCPTCSLAWCYVF